MKQHFSFYTFFDEEQKISTVTIFSACSSLASSKKIYDGFMQ